MHVSIVLLIGFGALVGGLVLFVLADSCVRAWNCARYLISQNYAIDDATLEASVKSLAMEQIQREQLAKPSKHFLLLRREGSPPVSMVNPFDAAAA